MIQKTSKSQKTKKFNNRFVELAKKKLAKKGFGKGDVKEIKKVWNNWLRYTVIPDMLNGDVVKMGKSAKIYVEGTLIVNNKKALSLFKRGRYIGRGGVKKANLKGNRKDVSYKIKYENKLAKNTVYFEPEPWLSGAVHDRIINSNVYFNING